MYRTDFWTLWEKVMVGCSERTEHSSVIVYYDSVLYLYSIVL